MLLPMASFHSFVWLSNIPLYVYTTSSLSITGHLNRIHVLGIIKGVAINIKVQISFHIIVFFLDICPGVGLMDHMATLFKVFEEPPYKIPEFSLTVSFRRDNHGYTQYYILAPSYSGSINTY